MWRLGCSLPLNYQTGNSVAGFNQLKLLAFYFAYYGGFGLVKK